MAPLIFIFGTSHVGKTTLANHFAKRLGLSIHSTDKMGRHPGRPWLPIPAPVAEHYTRLSDDTIYWFLRVHQENLWPHIHQQIRDAASQATGSIFEGSALRPEFLATLQIEDSVPVGLYADDAFLRDRMLEASNYRHQDAGDRLLIDKFITRSLRQNADFVDVATREGIPLLNAADDAELTRYADRLVADLRRNHVPISAAGTLP
jgi:2-phosphoglycerate kinase